MFFKKTELVPSIQVWRFTTFSNTSAGGPEALPWPLRASSLTHAHPLTHIQKKLLKQKSSMGNESMGTQGTEKEYQVSLCF